MAAVAAGRAGSPVADTGRDSDVEEARESVAVRSVEIHSVAVHPEAVGRRDPQEDLEDLEGFETQARHVVTLRHTLHSGDCYHHSMSHIWDNTSDNSLLSKCEARKKRRPRSGFCLNPNK